MQERKLIFLQEVIIEFHAKGFPAERAKSMFEVERSIETCPKQFEIILTIFYKSMVHIWLVQ